MQSHDFTSVSRIGKRKTDGYSVPYSPRGSVYDGEELEALRQLFESDATLSCGTQREAFEAEFQATLGTDDALAVASCTSGLELATQLLDLKEGDVVLVTPQTYQATANPLLGLPVEVRFVDVDENSLCVSPQSVRKNMGPRVRALFLTHYGGLMADMEALAPICNAHDVVIVEDCAHALGSRLHGKSPGSFGHLGCFSFQSMKNITTLGQGGMMSVGRKSWFADLRMIRAVEPLAGFSPRQSAFAFGNYPTPKRDLARHAKNAYTHDCSLLRGAGHNSTLSEPACAVGRVQLKKLDALIGRRREIARRLDAALAGLPGVRVQRQPDGYVHAYHLYTLFLDADQGLDRDAIGTAIEDAGVQVQLRYFPLHLLPEWRKRGGGFGQCPVTEKIWFEQQLNLPIYPSLTDHQVSEMIAIVDEAIRRVR